MAVSSSEEEESLLISQGPRSIFWIGTASSCVVGANERGRRENCRGVQGHASRKFLKFKASEIAENAFNFVNHW